ncbi:ASCH domain-containing protein [Patescibacteria group bacterium]|nr:ASCH domain-containing protein [Patescibacteria group bacterium]MBU4580583.1 ASCH domain-containing protein [Patescibacteria group bacterium]
MKTKNGKHLAIFTGPFLDLILEGKKTIESRFSKVRCAPYGVVKEGDIVLIKKAGGLVLGEFTVLRVETFNNLNETSLREMAKKYGKDLCADADKDFWEGRRDSHYATFLYVSKPIRYEKPFSYPKRDKRGWVVIKQASVGTQSSLFKEECD